MTSGVAPRHGGPGCPIELMWWGDGAVRYTTFISDRRALQIAADLVEMVLVNERARDRASVANDTKP